MKPLTSVTPHVIIMVGIPGAGKTTFAERFAKTFQAPIVSPEKIALSLGIDEPTSHRIAALMTAELVKAERTIIYDGPTHTRTSRLELIRSVKAAGYQPLLVWVQTESAEAKRRATKRRKDGTQMSVEEFDSAIKRFSPPSLTEKPVVISGKHTYASQLKIVLKHLAGQPRPDSPQAEPPHPRVRSSRNIIIR